MTYQTILTEQRGRVAIVTLNRPERLNALSMQLVHELYDAFERYNQDSSVGAIVLTGQGRAFCAGLDVQDWENPESPPNGEPMNYRSQLRWIEMMRESKPVVVAVNGLAVGGGVTLILSCDIRIASDKAKFGQPEVGLGIIPGFGGTQRMARIVGTGHALELILTGKTIDGQYAADIGLVNRVVPAEHLMEEALSLAETIARQAQLAVRSSKQAVRRGIQCDMDTAATYEALSFAICFDTEDQKDAMWAFVEKRKLEGFKNR